MRLAFAMLADAATVAEGKIYVHGGGWNRLTVDAVPAVQPSFAFVFVLELGVDESHDPLPLTLELVGETGPVATVRGAMQPTCGDGPSPHEPYLLAHAVTLTQVPLPHAGRYRLRMVCHDDRELGSVDLDVVATRPPSSTG
jgi:hypothetical protein